MGDTSKDCRNWEEEIFWTHFQSIHFFQFLHGDFLHRLEIPEKFAMNVMRKLPETVTLKGPSGVIWDVGLTEDDSTLYFNGGWKTFAEHHSLIENDFLVFRYNGLSHFNVLMFDGESLCEKASSYFVRKCMHSESECGHQTKRKLSENPDEIVHNSSQCGLESSLEKSTNNDINVRQSREAVESAATNKKKKIRNLDSGIPVKRSLGGKELSTFPGKRVATQAEKMNVLLKAQEALTDEGFMVVMKPTHVDRKFYMVNFIPELDRTLFYSSIVVFMYALFVQSSYTMMLKLSHVFGFVQSVPNAWVVKYLSRAKADVILRMNERTWKTRFHYYYHRSQERGGLSAGWRKFVNDNKLEEHDVCVFEPANIGSKPIMLNVSIFHVLPPVVPLNRVNRLPSTLPNIDKVVDASSLRAGN
ncbi:AP2/B3-like transcriptional factor family protein, putative isoform 2 [Hibiscus syriacus]|uniref:AP2/B3-like transcriptional factor family protein, putative isoform 2 n=1 Tax=Hibiscus syriacus TaxID=106335 RepID=A0A6A2Y681_HIBSY|nr:AP2/B3-like transcriptional factor family protein, putative isoform 2 [Hibiscus syriacus]